jgi:uncharacterized small protein (DUF1192 family)
MRAELLAAAVAGALAGVLGGFVQGRMSPVDKPAPAHVSSQRDEVRELAAQVAALQAEVTRLRQQRAASGAARPQVEAATPPGDAPAARPVVDDPVFEAAVRAVMDRAQQERAGEREERRAQATQRWADRLAEQAELTDAQKVKALAIAQELTDKVRELRDADAGSSQAFRAQRDALRAQSEQRLGEVLSARQMEIYRASAELQMEAGGARGGRRRTDP